MGSCARLVEGASALSPLALSLGPAAVRGPDDVPVHPGQDLVCLFLRDTAAASLPLDDLPILLGSDLLGEALDVADGPVRIDHPEGDLGLTCWTRHSGDP